MRQECWELSPRHRLQRNPLVNDPAMHRGTCVTHIPWYMSGSLTLGCGENIHGIPGACATRNFTYLARGPLHQMSGILYRTSSLVYQNKDGHGFVLLISVADNNLLSKYDSLTHIFGINVRYPQAASHYLSQWGPVFCCYMMSSPGYSSYINM